MLSLLQEARSTVTNRTPSILEKLCKFEVVTREFKPYGEPCEAKSKLLPKITELH